MSEPERFGLDLVYAQGVGVLVVWGEVDGEEAREIVSASDTGRSLVLDLARCGFMGAAGLQALLVLRRQVHEAGGRFAVVCRPGSQVARLFETVGGDGLFPIHGERAEALAALASGDRRSGRERRGAVTPSASP